MSFQEELWRAALHDFNNVFAGLQAALDLRGPGAPLTERDHQRLKASLSEGIELVAFCRALALERWPDQSLEPGPIWRQALDQRLMPFIELFRCPITQAYSGEPHYDQWPGPLLQSWILAFTRQLLPLIAPGPLTIESYSDAFEWRLCWRPVPFLPKSLSSAPGDFPKNLMALWVLKSVELLNLTLEEFDQAIWVSMSRTR